MLIINKKEGRRGRNWRGKVELHHRFDTMLYDVSQWTNVKHQMYFDTHVTVLNIVWDRGFIYTVSLICPFNRIEL